MILAGALGPIVLLFLTLSAKKDFTAWWTRFHLLTFVNDLWLLDPEKDWLIRMFPEQFFYDAVKGIAVRFAMASVAFLALGLVVRYRPSHHRHENF